MTEPKVFSHHDPLGRKPACKHLLGKNLRTHQRQRFAESLDYDRKRRVQPEQLFALAPQGGQATRLDTGQHLGRMRFERQDDWLELRLTRNLAGALQQALMAEMHSV